MHCFIGSQLTIDRPLIVGNKLNYFIFFAKTILFKRVKNLKYLFKTTRRLIHQRKQSYSYKGIKAILIKKQLHYEINVEMFVL